MALLSNKKIKKQYNELKRVVEEYESKFGETPVVHLPFEENKYYEYEDMLNYLIGLGYVERDLGLEETSKKYFNSNKVFFMTTPKFKSFSKDYKDFEKENNKSIKRLWIVTIIGWILASLGVVAGICF